MEIWVPKLRELSCNGCISYKTKQKPYSQKKGQISLVIQRYAWLEAWEKLLPGGTPRFIYFSYGQEV
jgi:hypothetical protein